jgi:hypothetical protein
MESKRLDEAKRADLIAHPLDPLLEQVTRQVIACPHLACCSGLCAILQYFGTVS